MFPTNPIAIWSHPWFNHHQSKTKIENLLDPNKPTWNLNIPINQSSLKFKIKKNNNRKIERGKWIVPSLVGEGAGAGIWALIEGTTKAKAREKMHMNKSWTLSTSIVATTKNTNQTSTSSNLKVMKDNVNVNVRVLFYSEKKEWLGLRENLGKKTT